LLCSSAVYSLIGSDTFIFNLLRFWEEQSEKWLAIVAQALHVFHEVHHHTEDVINLIAVPHDEQQAGVRGVEGLFSVIQLAVVILPVIIYLLELAGVIAFGFDLPLLL